MLKLFNFLFENNQPDESKLKEYAIEQLALKLFPRNRNFIDQESNLRNACKIIAEKLYSYFPTEFNINPRQIFNGINLQKLYPVINILIMLYGKDFDKIRSSEYLQMYKSLDEMKKGGTNLFKIDLGVDPNQHLEQKQISLLIQNMEKLTLLLKNDESTLNEIAEFLSKLARISIEDIKAQHQDEYNRVKYLGISDYLTNRSSVIDMILMFVYPLHGSQEVHAKYMLFIDAKLGGNLQEKINDVFNFNFKEAEDAIKDLQKLEKNMQNLTRTDQEGNPASLRYMETDEEGNQTITKIDDENILYKMKAIKIIKLCFLILKEVNSFTDKLKSFLQILTGHKIISIEFITAIDNFKNSLKTFYNNEIKDALKASPEDKFLFVFGDARINLHKKFDQNQYINAYNDILESLASIEKISKDVRENNILNILTGRFSDFLDTIIINIATDFKSIMESLNKIISYADFNDVAELYLPNFVFNPDDLETEFIKENFDLVKQHLSLSEYY